MFGFTCLIKADTDLVKRCLQESKNDVELLTALYDEVLDTDTDAEGMWPTEELATPVEEYSLIFGCREASELIYFAEGMRYAKFLKDNEWEQASVIVSDEPGKFRQTKEGVPAPRVVSPYDIPGIYDIVFGTESK